MLAVLPTWTTSPVFSLLAPCHFCPKYQSNHPRVPQETPWDSCFLASIHADGVPREPFGMTELHLLCRIVASQWLLMEWAHGGRGNIQSSHGLPSCLTHPSLGASTQDGSQAAVSAPGPSRQCRGSLYIAV